MDKHKTIFYNGELKGDSVISKTTKVKNLVGVFADETQRSALDQEQLVYEVQMHMPVADGTLGGLFFGITKLYAGKIGDEYYMTRGHFHKLEDRAEYYWGIAGEGMLVLMDRNRHTSVEHMYPGSLHYIPAHTAHRVVNTGDSLLVFGACWPSDAGHNYEEIEKHGFSARLFDVSGQLQIVQID